MSMISGCIACLLASQSLTVICGSCHLPQVCSIRVAKSSRAQRRILVEQRPTGRLLAKELLPARGDYASRSRTRVGDGSGASGQPAQDALRHQASMECSHTPGPPTLTVSPRRHSAPPPPRLLNRQSGVHPLLMVGEGLPTHCLHNQAAQLIGSGRQVCGEAAVLVRLQHQLVFALQADH